MTDDNRSGFHPEKIAAVVTSMAQMIEARGGPDGEFARRIAQLIQSGARGTTADERRFLDLAADLARLFKATGLFP
jgi:hypothetical protein